MNRKEIMEECPEEFKPKLCKFLTVLDEKVSAAYDDVNIIYINDLHYKFNEGLEKLQKVQKILER